MLPLQLHGPSLSIRFSDAAAFIENNAARFPRLDPDFISQICYEHPGRFNEILPDFDASIHHAKRSAKKASWILENVTYDDGESIATEWAWHVDRFLDTGERGSEVLEPMLANGTWPFPPVIVEATFAKRLNAPDYIGSPYYLIEGTHRVSYLSRLVDLGRIQLHAELEVIEVVDAPDSSGELGGL